ncbi:DUF4974 domain-containing protein [Mucilaginibacter daejeonensis]|uniref:FecR family protein n=1 Tax=Mucilaginibacter daejeonensis TaxID=398049 RepID=UPI001D17BF47|nr:FecR domain-containing protein [Mucilaginibacter daejeonensis]UEG55182.1 DUF4974 domain-containing protein [Mucilaginibacter daejeonensis]
MSNQRISYLLRRYADNSISKEEYLELISFFKLKGNDDEIDTALDDIWNSLSPDDVEHHEMRDLYKRLIANPRFQSKNKVRKMYTWLPYAAAAILVVALSVTLYLRYNVSNKQSIALRYKNDVSPGSNKATLTLADGKIIDLAGIKSGELNVQPGMHIFKTRNGQLIYKFDNKGNSVDDTVSFNTITTPKGGQYQINLPDGSQVWLNAASSLKFPIRFGRRDRKVTLTGEGYFEVAHNAKKPFTVMTADQQVMVLGTRFNINSYRDNAGILTTLLEGSVRVTEAGFGQMIKPGEQAESSATGINVSRVEAEDAIAWKNGLFVYNDQDLESIMKQVARWYNVQVVFEDANVKKQLYSGSLSRFKDLSQLLEVLEATGSVHFKIEGRVVTAMN